MAYKSAYKFIYKALRDALVRTGVPVGGTASYPRVELHSFIESQALDKEGRVRVISCTMESMSDTSLEDCVYLNEINLERLENITTVGADFTIIGIIPNQLQDLSETTDTKNILYRQLQSLDITIEQTS